MSRPDTYQRIVAGDEPALRDAFRRYGGTAHALAKRIVGAEHADDVVEATFLLIWCEPQRWASEALDVHVLRITRDLALATWRRGIAASIAAQSIAPFPITPDPDVPDIVHERDQHELQRALLRLTVEQQRVLEDAWFNQAPTTEPLDAALEWISSALAPSRSDPSTAMTDPDNDQELSDFFLGLSTAETRDEVAQRIRTDPELQQRTAIWPSAAAAIPIAAMAIDATEVHAQLEQRIIQRARIARPPVVRAHRGLQRARRGFVWVLLAAAVATATLFGLIAFRPDEPIGGHAVALSDDGRAGVLLPRYEDRLFALVFWGLPELDGGERWQLWLVRESGTVEAGPIFDGDAEGRAAVYINPNLLESADPVFGFTVSRDDPANREAETPSSDDILYQFIRD